MQQTNPTYHQNVYQMHFHVSGGGVVILQWPKDITPEWVDFMEQAIALQVTTIRRHALKRAAEISEATSVG